MLNTGTAPEHYTVVLTTAVENTHLYVLINSSIKHENIYGYGAAIHLGMVAT